MTAESRNLMLDAFDSNWIAPLGPHVNAFEQEMSNYLGFGHAAVLSTGTAALHIALKLAGVKSGDFVLCPSLTFASTANVILYEKAIPIFIDVKEETWTLNPELLEKAIAKYKPKVLITVDLYGQSADYDQIINICNKYDVSLIEDAAEALGAEYKGKKCGVFGNFGVFSFNGNKIITTGGGGMLISKNKKLIEKARFLSTQAREPEIYYEHKELGYNYRMSNLLAALGRGQLKVLDQRVNARRKVAKRYYNRISKIDGIKFMPEAKYGRATRWLTTLTINSNVTGINRTQIIQELEKNNIEARPVWKPMHMQPLYKKCEYIIGNNNDISKKIFENGICLPSGSNLSKIDQDRIIEIIVGNLSK